MLHHAYNLFCDICNATNEHSKIRNHYHSLMFPTLFLFLGLKKRLTNFICFIINHDFYIIIFECITRSSSLSLEVIDLIAIISWKFDASDFLGSFRTSLRYGLLLLRYSSFNSVLFLSPLFSYSIRLLLRILPAFAGL